MRFVVETFAIREFYCVAQVMRSRCCPPDPRRRTGSFQIRAPLFWVGRTCLANPNDSQQIIRRRKRRAVQNVSSLWQQRWLFLTVRCHRRSCRSLRHPLLCETHSATHPRIRGVSYDNLHRLNESNNMSWFPSVCGKSGLGLVLRVSPWLSQTR